MRIYPFWPITRDDEEALRGPDYYPTRTEQALLDRIEVLEIALAALADVAVQAETETVCGAI